MYANSLQGAYKKKTSAVQKPVLNADPHGVPLLLCARSARAQRRDSEWPGAGDSPQHFDPSASLADVGHTARLPDRHLREAEHTPAPRSALVRISQQTDYSPLQLVTTSTALVADLDTYLAPYTFPLGGVHQIVDPRLDIVRHRILIAPDEYALAIAIFDVNEDFLAVYDVFPGIALSTPNTFLSGVPWNRPFLDWVDMLRTVYAIHFTESNAPYACNRLHLVVTSLGNCPFEFSKGDLVFFNHSESLQGSGTVGSPVERRGADIIFSVDVLTWRRPGGPRTSMTIYIQVPEARAAKFPPPGSTPTRWDLEHDDVEVNADGDELVLDRNDQRIAAEFVLARRSHQSARAPETFPSPPNFSTAHLPGFDSLPAEVERQPMDPAVVPAPEQLSEHGTEEMGKQGKGRDTDTI
jgi:hypothetical protein